MNEGFRYVRDYLYSELEEVENLYKELSNKEKSLELEIREIASRLGLMKGNIDFAYEAFSPSSDKNNFLNDEIEHLEMKQMELLKKQEEIAIQIQNHKEKIGKLKKVINELNGVNAEEEIQERVDKICCTKLIKEQELERQRIASDLHDTVIQMMTGLIHKIEFCTKVIDMDPVRVKLEMQLINKIIRDSINGIRDIIFDLRPMTFDDFGFDETLKRAVEKISKNSDIKMEFQISGDSFEMDQMISISLYRIMLEACVNSMKHSNAKNLNVTLSYYDNYVILSIKDDGDGFDINDIQKANDDGRRIGFGLAIMRERVSLLSGDFKIETGVNLGTEVLVKIYTNEKQGE